MSEIETQQIVKSQPPRSKKLGIILEAFTLLGWVVLICKLLIFDLDVYVIQNYTPDISWVLKYKFFILISILAFVWWLVGSRRFGIALAFVAFYPFIFIFWRVPHLLLRTKSWIGIFAAIGVTVSFLKSLKLNFAIFVSVCLASLTILVSRSAPALIGSLIVLLVYLSVHFIRRFFYVFKPLEIFSMQANMLTRIWKRTEGNFRLGEEMKHSNYRQMTEEQKEKWAINLQFLLIFNRICYFLVSKLRGFQRSRVAVFYYMINIAFTVAVTISVYAFVNLALAKIDHTSFTRGPEGGLGLFLYYSFNTLFTNAINDFYPLTGLAKLLNCSEIICSFLIAVILFFLLTTIVREKHREEVDEVIVGIAHHGNAIEKAIKEDFSLTLEEATLEVEKMKGALLKIIHYLASNID